MAVTVIADRLLLVMFCSWAQTMLAASKIPATLVTILLAVVKMFSFVQETMLN